MARINHLERLLVGLECRPVAAFVGDALQRPASS